MIYKLCFLLVAYFIVILNVPEVSGNFEEYSIFEDEDIYKRPITIANASEYSNATIVPGTKWCGPGDIASNYDDLGMYREADKCCREHDHCSDLMFTKKSSHGLHNPDQYTRLCCDCEQKFINCLQNTNDWISKVIGYIYYRFRTVCFKNDYPISSCIEYQSGFLTEKRCIKYKLDTSKPKKWQWFDMPFYTTGSRR